MINRPTNRKATAMIRHTILPLFGLLFALLAITAVFTTATIVRTAQDCDATGGHFSFEGGTIWCRY